MSLPSVATALSLRRPTAKRVSGETGPVSTSSLIGRAPLRRFFARWSTSIYRLNLPTVVLLALLQRVPVLRWLLTQPESAWEKPGGEVLKTLAAAAAALGTVQTLAGATTFTPTTTSPASATVGTPASFAFAVTGAPSTVKSWTITGSVPPGLLFYNTSTGTTGGVSTGTVNTTTLYLHGTPTTAGGSTFSLKAWEKTGGTGNSSPSYSYTINVTGSSAAPPTITTQPQSVTVTAGASASFTVAASGTAPLSYQWKKDSAAIGGASAATYSLAATQVSDAGSYTVDVSNSAGTVTSSAATLTVNAAAVAPSITAQPQSVTVTAGASASFSVTASGTAPLSYQWKKGSADISGATAATYSISAAQASDAGSYNVVITNSAGSVTSSAATLTVNAAAVAPSITTQPQSITVTAGGSASFSVVASGTAPLTYQWKKGTTAITGATTDTYSISSAQSADAGNYSVVVTNSVGSVTSSTATLTVTAAAVAPTITAQPQSLAVTTGSSASFSVIATGTAPLSYQWKKGGVNLTAATSDTYTIASAQASDAADYTVVVSNSAGSATSTKATLTVNSAATAPTITTQPQSASASAGASVTFSVTATGTAPLSYQWKKDAVNLSGATNSSYTIAAAQSTDAGSYTVAVSNSAGSVTSSAAVLTVSAVTNTAPTITAQPQGADVLVGTNVILSVTASGASLTYQWSKDGVAVPNATSASFVLGAVQLADAGIYTVTVSNGSGSVTSLGATLNVRATTPTTNARLVNIATRSAVGSGADIQIAGFVIEGSGPKTVLIRANGPALAAANLPGLLADPVLKLFNGPTLVAQNDDWNATLATTFSQVGAQPWTVGSLDAALLVTLQPGRYTAQVSGKNGSTGLALIEVYEADGTSSASKLVNLSTRSTVGTGANLQIAGFVIQGTTPKKVVIRGGGPSLEALGVTGVLDDPVLRVWRGQTVIAENDDWDAAISGDFAAVGATAWLPGSKDAALVLTLPPGVYTAHVFGKNGQTGVALVEVYEEN